MEVLFYSLILFLGLILIYFVLKKDLEKIESQKFLELINKFTENFNLLKQDVLKSFELTSQTQDKLLESHLNKLTENFGLLKQDVYTTLETTLQKQEKVIEIHSKIEEIARNLESSASEVKSFKEILAGPKSRGYFGEIMLEEILKSLPSNYYEKQYTLGLQKVDYVLKFNNTLIPIDAKFPIQNFSKILEPEEKNKEALKKELIKNLKNKIEEISRKYIQPSKGTVEYALMYLANESIYYELLSDKDYQEVWELAKEKSIFLTSPKTFELLCSYFLLIKRKEEFGKNLHQILENLHQLAKELSEVRQLFTTAYNQLTHSYENFTKIERILNTIYFTFNTLLKNQNLPLQKSSQN